MYPDVGGSKNVSDPIEPGQAFFRAPTDEFWRETIPLHGLVMITSRVPSEELCFPLKISSLNQMGVGQNLSIYQF